MLQRVAACEDLAQLVKPESGFSRSFPQNSTYLFNPTEFKKKTRYPQKSHISRTLLSAKEPYISRTIIRVLWGGYD